MKNNKCVLLVVRIEDEGPFHEKNSSKHNVLLVNFNEAFWGRNLAIADDSTILKFPQEINYVASGKGVETAVLYGDPSKPGLYVVRLKLPAGAKVMPHIHPGEARTMTVLSGTLYFGFGTEFDETKLKPYPAGTFFTELPTTPHFVAAKEGEVIFQATGIGPSGMIDSH